MFRELALSLLLSLSAFALSKNSFATNYVNYGTPVNYDLNPADSLFVASGTYTGNITGFDAGARITIANGAIFTPGAMPHNANGTIHNYGIFTYTAAWTVNTNFTVNNYAGGIMAFGSITIRGNSQTWTNYGGGVITFTEVLMNGNDDDLNNIMINYDSVRCAGNFQMNSGSAFVNYKDFNVGGVLRVNGGTLNNEGNLLVTGNILMNNGASIIRNYCRMQANGGITNTSGNFYNYSYLWAVNSDIINTANIVNSSYASGASAPNLATTPMIHARNFTISGQGTVTGPCLMYFYGTTTMTGGTMGVAGATTDTIKFYDITRTVPAQIFDVQSGGTRHPNFIYNAWGVPDSTRNYLLGCSMEVILESPLAVNWRSFEVVLSNSYPLLIWSAEFDRSTVFEIQRSYNGRNFSTIDKLNAVDGKTDYRYLDRTVNTQSPTVYYRILAVETDSYPKFSQVRMLRLTQLPGAAQVAPNPFKNNFNIIYSATVAGNVTIRVFNMNGQQKMARRVAVNKGSNTLNVVEAANFANGIYIVQVTSDDRVFSTKLIKQ